MGSGLQTRGPPSTRHNTRWCSDGLEMTRRMARR
jgi:hypothetical protein